MSCLCRKKWRNSSQSKPKFLYSTLVSEQSAESDQRTCLDHYKVRFIDVSVHPHGPPSGLGIKAYTGTSATQKERRPGPDFCRGEGEILVSLLLQASKKWLFSEIFWETQKWVLTQFGSVNLFELCVYVCF